MLERGGEETAPFGSDSPVFSSSHLSTPLESGWVPLDRGIGHNPFAEHTRSIASVEDRATCAVGPAVSETPVGIEPTSPGLQPVAWPSGFSVVPKPKAESGERMELSP